MLISGVKRDYMTQLLDDDPEYKDWLDELERESQEERFQEEAPEND